MDAKKHPPTCQICGYTYTPEPLEQKRQILFIRDLETGEVDVICADCLDQYKGRGESD